RALRAETGGRPAVDHRILHLMRGDGSASGEDLRQALPIEVRQADMSDLPGPAQLVEPDGRFDINPNAVVPPMELDHIETLQSEARERSIHSPHNVASRVSRQSIEIGNIFRVNLYAGSGARAPLSPLEESADQRFDAGVDIRAIKRRDACLDESIHIVQGGRFVDRPVAAGQL